MVYIDVLRKINPSEETMPKSPQMKRLVLKYRGRVWLRMTFDGDTAKTTYQYVPKKPSEAYMRLRRSYNLSRKPRKLI